MKIRAILGNTAEVYDGCLSDVCLDSNTTEWEMVTNYCAEVQTKKCNSCGYPSWYRRAWCPRCEFTGDRRSLVEGYPYFESTRMWLVPVRPCNGCERALKKRRGN